MRSCFDPRHLIPIGRRPLRPLLLRACLVALMAVGACESNPQSPTSMFRFYNVAVGTETVGENQPCCGYEVLANDEVIGSQDNQAVKTYSLLEGGAYEIRLNGIPGNCSVDGDNPVTVFVSGAEIARVDFRVECT